jgi:hypothetical protein
MKTQKPISYGEVGHTGRIILILPPLGRGSVILFRPESFVVLLNTLSICSHVDIPFSVCYSNFLTILYDTKEEVQRAYKIMKEGSTTIYKMEATPYSSCCFVEVFVNRFH